MWTFDRRAGEIRNPAGHRSGTAYAGHGAARNNPEFEGEHGRMEHGKIVAGGPLPGGQYHMERVEHHPTAGPFFIRLRPDDETRARIVELKREPDSFGIHGDSLTHDASEGCICTNRAQREIMWSSTDHWIHVI
jgi:hypothetical protein